MTTTTITDAKQITTTEATTIPNTKTAGEKRTATC